MGAQVLEWSARVVLMALATAAALRALRIRGAGARHLAWTGVVAAMLLLPAWTAWGPKVTVPVLPAVQQPLAAAPQLQRGEVPMPDTAPLSSAAPPVSAMPQVQTYMNWNWIAIGCYLLGLGALLFRFVAGTFHARLLVRRARLVAGLRTSAQCVAPVTVGWFRPVVVLPEGWQNWSEAELDAVLTHEREHVRRRDPLVQWLAMLNRCIFWFHPLAWWLERKLSALAEDACDAAVLRRGHDPRDYSAYLIDLARSVERAGARVTVWGAAIGGSTLSARIHRMMQGRPAPALSRRRATAAAAICVLTLAAFAACKLERAQKPAQGQLSMNAMAKRDAGERKKSADKEQALLAEARGLTPDQAAAKIAGLKANPQDNAAYYQLMRYFEFKSDVLGKNVLILWYIEHQPAGTVRPWHINPAGDRAGYARGKRLWLENVKKPGASADVYDRAAAFLEGADKPLAEDILLAGRKAYPNDSRWEDALGRHYAQVLLGSAEPRTEYNVFRVVSAKEANSPYARSVRAKLVASDDAPMLAQTAQWLIAWGRGPNGRGLNSDIIGLATAYADRALALEPDSKLARQIGFSTQNRKEGLRLAELGKLPPAEQARLSDRDRMLLLPRLMSAAWSKGSLDDAAAKARELLGLAARNPKDPSYGDAVFEANIMLGKAALRRSDKRASARYLLAAAETPGSEQLRRSYIQMNLPRALVDWGERDAVAQFLERMAPKTDRAKDFQDWAAQIRKGINPDMGPTRVGCGQDPC